MYVSVHYLYAKTKAFPFRFRTFVMCTEISVVDILRIFGFQIGEMMVDVVEVIVVVVGFFVRMIVLVVVDI